MNLENCRMRTVWALLLATLIRGVCTAGELSSSAQPTQPVTGAGSRAAILHEPGMPIKGAASSPETIANPVICASRTKSKISLRSAQALP